MSTRRTMLSCSDDHERERPPVAAASSSELAPRIYRFSSPDAKLTPQHRAGTPISHPRHLPYTPHRNDRGRAAFHVDSSCPADSSSHAMDLLPPKSPSSPSIYNGGKMYRKSIQYQLERKERKQKQLEDPISEGLTRPQSTSSLGLLPIVKSSSSLGTTASAPTGTGQSSRLEAARYGFTESEPSRRSFKPPSAKTSQRLQHGLEKSYPLYRMDAKKKEERFLLLTRKAEKYSKNHRVMPSSTNTTIDDAAALRIYPQVIGTVGAMIPPPALKENDPPMVSQPVSPSFVAKRANTVKFVEDDANADSGLAATSRAMGPSLSHSGGYALPPSPSSSAVDKNAKGSSKLEILPRKLPTSSRNSARYSNEEKHSLAMFDIGAAAMNCMMPPIDEQIELRIDTRALKIAHRDRRPSRKANTNSPRSADGLGERRRMKATRDELLKLKDAQRMRKQLQFRREREKVILAGTTKAVRFAEPLVTDVRHRPYTRPEEKEKLFFVEEELDELEWDRATVDGDQFELAIDSSRIGFGADMHVSVTYMNKRNLFQGHLEEGGDGIPFSPSDLSAYYELHAM